MMKQFSLLTLLLLVGCGGGGSAGGLTLTPVDNS